MEVYTDGVRHVVPVSAVNDDNVDNRFAVSKPRFAQIEEDEPIQFPLCNEVAALTQ